MLPGGPEQLAPTSYHLKDGRMWFIQIQHPTIRLPLLALASQMIWLRTWRGPENAGIQLFWIVVKAVPEAVAADLPHHLLDFLPRWVIYFEPFLRGLCAVDMLVGIQGLVTVGSGSPSRMPPQLLWGLVSLPNFASHSSILKNQVKIQWCIRYCIACCITLIALSPKADFWHFHCLTF